MKPHTLSRLIYVLSCIPAAAALGGPAIRYQFELRSGDDAKPAVRVHLLTAGSDAASSRFAVQSHWGGVDHSERFIHALSAASREKTLTIRPAEDRPSAWIVEHQPNAPLEITYELRPGDKEWLAEAGNHYEPIVRDDLFHMIGENGLLTPELLDEDAEQDIRVEWQGFAERGW